MYIDKEKIYQLGDYRFKNFILLSKEEIKSVWEWRNNDAIRKYMYNTDIIPYENHIHFINSLATRKDVAYWLVYKGEQAVGVTNLTSIDIYSSKAELGYYIVPELMNSGIGIDFAFNNFLFAFTCIGCSSLFGGIDKRNINAIMLDSYLGCKLNESDVENIKDISYIKWTLLSKDFMHTKDVLNNIREFVCYMKTNKEYFNKIKENAGII